jgi:diaminopimelate epimerase
MQLHFSKYHGAGNDFVMIDNREGVFGDITVEKIQSICNRHTGVGADGIILLDTYAGLDFRMRYFNADLGDETMCGNGTRCIVAFAHQLGIIKNKARFQGRDGMYEAEILSEGIVSTHMQDVHIAKAHKDGFVCDTGCPHYVEAVSDTTKVDIVPFGRAIRYSSDFPSGINVNVVEVVDGDIRMRTYERGVENETLACGTGAVAVAVTLAKDARDGEKKHFKIKAPGGDLEVRLTREGDMFTDVWLTGPAVKAFEGTIHI